MLDSSQTSDSQLSTISPPTDEAVRREVQRRSRRAFLLTGLTALASLGGWRWLVTRPDADGVAWPLRRVLDANGKLASAYFSEAHLAPVFPISQAKEPRTNGDLGLSADFNPAAWRLQVQGYAPAGASRREQAFTLADIQALPKTEVTTELKCIEGWSIVVHWAGARLADFLARYPLATTGPAPGRLAPYVSLATPDEEYYVGLDMASALHPQTLLCYEMNGQPLTPEHGAPLRLVTPVKYGIKYIKRIGTIAFTDQRPADYWAEQGYDWNAGH